jgi:16S rRNA (cytidine1402-2'-O)-methyltransferase
VVNAELSPTPQSVTRERGGALFVVATPIGNLDDITLRAIATLRAVSVIAAEDTRRARTLLSHLGITGKRLVCIDAHAQAAEIHKLVDLMASGEQVALLTDAGTPSISDPGSALVRASQLEHVLVSAIPGPSAVTTAIAVSGVVESSFLFLGFVPRKGSKRKAVLRRVQNTADAVVLFESPSRVNSLLQELASLMPERVICIARELTKKFEEVTLRTAAEWATSEHELRGEITLVVAPDKTASGLVQRDDAALLRVLEALLAQGASAKEASALLAAVSGESKRVLYQMALAVGDKRQ